MLFTTHINTCGDVPTICGYCLQAEIRVVDQVQLSLGALRPKNALGLSTLNKGLFRPKR